MKPWPVRSRQSITANILEPSVRMELAISAPHCSGTTFTTQSNVPGGLQIIITPAADSDQIEYAGCNRLEIT